MKVLLTGATSFTGYWFALHAQGAQVVAPLRMAAASYFDGTRAERVLRLGSVAEIIDAVSFGSERFLDLVNAGACDLLCHHAARVSDYRSPDFDVAGALAENTHNLRAVLDALAKGGLKGVLLTGRVFEQDEGAGDVPHRRLLALRPVEGPDRGDGGGVLPLMSVLVAVSVS
jgi:nucleoside-diphosphate-sugar epimerase